MYVELISSPNASVLVHHSWTIETLLFGCSCKQKLFGLKFKISQLELKVIPQLGKKPGTTMHGLIFYVILQASM